MVIHWSLILIYCFLFLFSNTDHSCHPFGGGEHGIFVSKVVPDGLAARTAKIRIGDRLLSVNGNDLTASTHGEAVNALIAATKQVVLRVRHEPLPNGWTVSLLFVFDCLLFY